MIAPLPHIEGAVRPVPAHKLHRAPSRWTARRVGRWLRLAVGPWLLLAACQRGAPPAAPQPSAGGAGARRDIVATSVREAVSDSLRAVLDRAVADGAFPGAYAVVGNRDGVIAEYGAGRLDSADATRPTANTLWDLASLTKVVGTTSAVLQLVGSGRVALDSPVVRYLPEWTAPGASQVTVRHLLSHNAGLPAWRALYKEADTADDAWRLILATPLDTVPGVRFVYSDLGFLLLGRLVERISGEPLAEYGPAHVFGPAGMRETRYLPPSSWRARIAPTEQDPWRQRKLRGEVHDENAARMGGVAGHAGLFSTAADLARFARLYLNHGTLDGVRVFDSATVAVFTRVQNATVSRRALGWETPTGRNSAGTRLADNAFGHTGFTGTSLWMDPSQNLFVVLLTNRVNPTRQNTRIGAVRVAVADAAVGALRGAGHGGGPGAGSR